MQHELRSSQHIPKLEDSFCTSKHPMRLRASLSGAESNRAVTEGIAAKTERAKLG